MSYSYLTEAFKKLNLLEDDFNFSSDAHRVADELQAFVADDIDAPEEEIIIDTEADTENDLQDTYVGKVILECACCHSRIYKNSEDVVISEEGDLANVEETCPVCNTESGFKVIGKIEAFNGEKDFEEPVEEPEVEEHSDDDLTDDEIEEALKEALNENADDPNCEFKSDRDAIEYWNENHNSDPVLSDYVDEYGANAMEVWLKDSRENGYICNESLTEDLNDVEVKTEQGNVDVQKDGNKVTIDFAPTGDDLPVEEPAAEEMIAPLNDEDIAEIEGNDLDMPLEDDGLGLEPDLDVVDDGIDAEVEDDLGLEADLEEIPEEEDEEDELPNESLKSDGGESLTEEKHICEKCGKDPCECEEEEDKLDEDCKSDEKDKEVKEACSEEECEDCKEALDVSDAAFANNKLAAALDAGSMTDLNMGYTAEVINELPGDATLDEAGEVLLNEIEKDELMYEDFNEVNFDSLCESYLKRVYENVNSFKTTECKLSEGILNVTGSIEFESGKTKTTTFAFSNPTTTKRGAVVLEGMNKTFSNSAKAFTLRGNVIDNSFVAESMIYNYSTKTLNESNESEAVKVYGRTAIKK